MTVTLKLGSKPLDIGKAFGIPPEEMLKAADAGITFKLMPSSLVIAQEGTLYPVSLSLKASMAIYAGGSAPGYTCYEATTKLKQLLLMPSAPVHSGEPIAPSDTDIIAAELASPNPVVCVSATSLSPQQKPIPSAQNANEIVSLAQATFMYQRVNGTSPGSVYRVVAMAEGLALAARYHGDTLSLRAEGSKLKVYAPKLAQGGFSPVKETYTSLHLKTPKSNATSGELLAARAMCAVIGGLGIPFETQMPQLKIVQG